jgi:hypothetical protein
MALLIDDFSREIVDGINVRNPILAKNSAFFVL